MCIVYASILKKKKKKKKKKNPPVQAPAPAPTAQTMSLGDATPVGTFATNQTDKLANADPVVEPGDVQLDFA